MMATHFVSFVVRDTTLVASRVLRFIPRVGDVVEFTSLGKFRVDQVCYEIDDGKQRAIDDEELMDGEPGFLVYVEPLGDRQEAKELIRQRDEAERSEAMKYLEAVAD